MAALYETWTFQEELPDLFQKLIHDLGRTKTSTKVSDCSQYNSLRAKSATLHAAHITCNFMAVWGICRCRDGRCARQTVR